MDIWTPQKRSEVMSKVRSKGNKTTEMPLASTLLRLGVKGWRSHLTICGRSVSVKPDFVFESKRVAVFVDGCFWHSCPIHGTRPKSNMEFWDKKLTSNKNRDLRVNAALRDDGWTVLRFWEHAIKNDSEACAGQILIALLSS